MWTPEQYLAEIPVLAKYKMNFLMNCYSTMCDVEHHVGRAVEATAGGNRCRNQEESVRKVVRACQEQRHHLLLQHEPATLFSQRFVNSGKRRGHRPALSALRLDAEPGREVVQHLAGRHHCGRAIDARRSGQGGQRDLRPPAGQGPRGADDLLPDALLGRRHGAGRSSAYLETLARELDQDVYSSGPATPWSARITRKAADTLQGIVKHRLFLWDNYPVNDASPPCTSARSSTATPTCAR